MPICRYRFLRPLLTASVLPWHARRSASSRTSPERTGILSRCGYSVVGAIHHRKPGKGPVYQFFLAAARSAVPICRPGHQYRGQNKSRFRLEAAHFVQKTKCADLNMKSAAVGRFFAHCNRKSLAAANTRSRFSASNTVLLTCVIGNPPCAHILPSHRSSLQWRTFVPADRSASAWPHAHSTVSCRHKCLLLSLSCPRVCGIGVYYGINNMNLSVGFRP